MRDCPVVELEAILAEAEETVAEVAWSMALEGQRITDEAASRIVRRLVIDALGRPRSAQCSAGGR